MLGYGLKRKKSFITVSICCLYSLTCEMDESFCRDMLSMSQKFEWHHTNVTTKSGFQRFLWSSFSETNTVCVWVCFPFKSALTQHYV